MTFQQVKEQFIKPPFKYWILPQGHIRGDFYTFSTIRAAKAKVEELSLKNGCAYDILNVYLSQDLYRKGYMSTRILSYDKKCGWFRLTGTLDALHTAFYFTDIAIERWNPKLYQKLKENYEKGKYDNMD